MVVGVVVVVVGKRGQVLERRVPRQLYTWTG